MRDVRVNERVQLRAQKAPRLGQAFQRDPTYDPSAALQVYSDDVGFPKASGLWRGQGAEPLAFLTAHKPQTLF